MATLPTNTSTQTGLAVAPALATAVKLDAPATPIEVVHGFGAAVEVKAERSAGADAALAVTPLPLPPGLAVPAANIAEKAATGAVTVTAAPEVPLGPMTIALTAKGKIANAEQVFAVPAVTLNVVRPAAITLAAPGVEVKAGATVEVKGKVERKAPFKEPVTVKVDGLPAGLKAEPVTVAPTESDFTLKLVADPKAAAAIGGRRRRAGLPDQQEGLPHAPRRARGQGRAGELTARARCRAPRPARSGENALRRSPLMSRSFPPAWRRCSLSRPSRPSGARTPRRDRRRAGKASPRPRRRSASSRTWRRSWSRTASPATTPRRRRASTP